MVICEVFKIVFDSRFPMTRFSILVWGVSWNIQMQNLETLSYSIKILNSQTLVNPHNVFNPEAKKEPLESTQKDSHNNAESTDSQSILESQSVESTLKDSQTLLESLRDSKRDKRISAYRFQRERRSNIKSFTDKHGISECFRISRFFGYWK